jgi:transglutaminase-like putative cysteine protease
VLEGALELTARIFKEFTFDPTATTVSTPVDEVFRHRRGVCQDFAHLQLACLRALRIPARYVSGYLLTRPPEGRTERLVGADASHAWLAVWCPGHGWVELDPTNNMVVALDHITLAWGREYSDISPVNGAIFGGGAHMVQVAVDVTPLSAPAAA